MISSAIYRVQLRANLPSSQACTEGMEATSSQKGRDFFQSSKPAYSTPTSRESFLKVDQRSDQHTAKIMILRAVLHRTLSWKINVMLNTSKQKKKQKVSLATALLRSL